MAKSIRSKIKRKHRAEFRRTFGTEAHNKAMEKVHSKLEEVVNKGSMKSFDRLADMLETDGEPMLDTGDKPVESLSVVASGENKAPAKGSFKKTVKRKHKMRTNVPSKEPPKSKKDEKPKPKYFCEF